jgi:hypothetical protein
MDMKKFYQTKEFKELQKYWYDKLRQQSSKAYPILEKTSNTLSTPNYALEKLSKLSNKHINQRNYYDAARAYSTHAKFDSKENKFIFNLHANGLPYRKIEKLFLKKFKRSISIWSISKLIQRLKPIMLEWNRTDPRGCFFKEDSSGL